jgi:hypothetical protein
MMLADRGGYINNFVRSQQKYLVVKEICSYLMVAPKYEALVLNMFV